MAVYRGGAVARPTAGLLLLEEARAEDVLRGLAHLLVARSLLVASAPADTKEGADALDLDTIRRAYWTLHGDMSGGKEHVDAHGSVAEMVHLRSQPHSLLGGFLQELGFGQGQAGVCAEMEGEGTGKWVVDTFVLEKNKRRLSVSLAETI